jgi:hypothetical protein
MRIACHEMTLHGLTFQRQVELSPIYGWCPPSARLPGRYCGR